MTATADVGYMLVQPATVLLPKAAQGVLPDSELRAANCGHLVWVSQAGLTMFERGSCYTICVSCDAASTDPVMHQSDMPKYAVPGVVDSARQLLGPAAADQMESWMRERGVREL